MSDLLRETQINGIRIQLMQGDITTAPVQALVNPANAQLEHGGGLAGLLSRRAGPALQQESRAWIQKHGPINHREPAHTSAGNLPFQTIIHAVGPVWGSGDEARKLHQAVTGSLQLAGDLELTSLALPAISTGVFGYPVDQAAEVILQAAAEFCQEEPSPSLELIQVYVYDQGAARAFETAWEKLSL